MRRQDSRALSKDENLSVTLTSLSCKLQGMSIEVGLDLSKFFESMYFIILFVYLTFKNFVK